MAVVTVIGGGLAGSEAAWQIAQRGIKVRLYEMRPQVMTPAHETEELAELVCSNSLGSDLESTAGGLLKRELALMDSLIINAAAATRVPAGSALAVDRHLFSQEVTRRLKNHALIEIVREECCAIPGGIVVIASGPLTSPALIEALRPSLRVRTFIFSMLRHPLCSAKQCAMILGSGEPATDGEAQIISTVHSPERNTWPSGRRSLQQKWLPCMSMRQTTMA